MQIHEKEAVKLLPPEDFIINNLSKKAMDEIAARLGLTLRSAKLAAARQLAQVYLYFPHQVAQLLDETARARMRAMLSADCEGDADAPGVSALVALGMAMILTEEGRRLAVVPRQYRGSVLDQTAVS